MIEFERLLPGDGTRPYTVTVADSIDLEPVGQEHARLCVRDRGEVVAQASYAKIRRLISLVRDRTASMLEAEP